MILVADLEKNPSLQTGGTAGLAALIQGENHRMLGLTDFLASLLPVYV